MVGLSGGVDSAVTAWLLKEQGFVVEALFMKNWEEDDTSSFCSAKEDLAVVRRVCQQLNLPLHTVNFAAEYWQRVFSEFLDEYQAGRTPNPDILCNKEIKFNECLNYALRLGADYMATGHYAQQIPRSDDGSGPAHYQLLKGADLNKDQSYFLYTLTQSQLAKSIFPIGHLLKSQVRTLAQQAGLINHARKDSTGICFIGERKFQPFLAEFVSPKPGPIETPNGQVLGQHQGLMFYTLGQRKGLQIGGQADSLALPWYVVGKDMSKHRLIVAQGQSHPWLYATQLRAQAPHWINPISLPLRCQAKIRYRQAPQNCQVQWAQNQLNVTFDTPQRAITPGQAIVFYAGQQCLGGATITTTNAPGDRHWCTDPSKYK